MTVIAQIPLASRADILGALAAHVEACRRDLRAHPAPPLYASGVRYRRSDPQERWQLPSEVRAAGGADCEDLASWRAAELRENGERATVTIKRTSPQVLHAVVVRADGRIEDPSRRLGMGREKIGSMNTNLRWKLRKVADGWEGEAEIPLPAGSAAVATRARGQTRGDAASRTLRALQDVTRSPLVSALLPPGAQPAIKAALAVSRSVARLFRRKKKSARASAAATPAAVSGYAMTMGAADVARALQSRGAPPELVRLGAACWGE